MKGDEEKGYAQERHNLRKSRGKWSGILQDFEFWGSAVSYIWFFGIENREPVGG